MSSSLSKQVVTTRTVELMPVRDQTFSNAGGDVTDEVVMREIFDENVYRFGPHQLTGGLVVDVGANIGMFSLLCLATNAEETVLSIEPDPNNRELLVNNLSNNDLKDRAVIIHEAVGYGEGFCTLKSGGGAAWVDDWTQGEIPTRSLPDILESTKYEGEIDILKMDCEGSEYPIMEKVFQTDLMQRVRWFVMEWHPTTPRQLGNMLGHLAITHSFDIIGVPNVGGMLWAHRHDV